MSLSGLLISAGPSNCAADTETRGFSGLPSCLQIDGVDMANAERLATEFRSYDEYATNHSEFCVRERNRSVPYLSPEDLAAEIEELEQNDSAAKADFFRERGYALLGEEQMSRLLSWANDHLKPNIDERKIDYARMMRRLDLSPEEFLQAFCSAEGNVGASNP